MKKNTLIVLSLVVLSYSCGMPNKSSLEFDDSGAQTLSPDMVVNYGVIKDQILASKCIGCHANAATEEGLMDWVTPGNPEASPLFVKTENGSMPKNGSPLPTRDLELLRMYIDQLAVAPAPAPGPAPAPTPGPTPTPTPPPTGNPGVTFAEIKSKILQEYRCTSCHSVSTEAQLSKWLNKTTPTSSRFYTITKSGTMPENGPRVNAQDMDLILQYVKDFAERN